MLDENLEEISKKTLENSSIPEDEKFGSVLLVIMLVGVLVNVIRVIQECDDDESNKFSKEQYSKHLRNKIVEIAKRKSFLSVMRLKRILRRNLARDAYAKYGDKLVKGIIKTGAELSENETYTLLEHLDD